VAEPSGRIVALEAVARSCGHAGEFQHYERDRYRAQRLAKFRSTRCPECAAAASRANEERQRAAAERARGQGRAGEPPTDSAGQG
jgi:hypothetical protein